MLTTFALALLYAGSPPDQTTLPRHPNPDSVQRQDPSEGAPTDPWYDGKFVATDDAAFILTAVESTRQAALDSRLALDHIKRSQVREAAQSISAQYDATTHELEALAKKHGWRLPADNPARKSSLAQADGARGDANYVINQIRYHENTLAQFRAQSQGNGDPELKQTLEKSVPAFQRNLEMLLNLKFGRAH
jgi:predicted outer membrane protein